MYPAFMISITLLFLQNSANYDFATKISNLISSKNWPELKDIAIKEISNNPNSVPAWNARGLAAANLQDHAELKNVLDNLEKIDPTTRVLFLTINDVDKFVFPDAPKRLKFSDIVIKLQPAPPSYPAAAKASGVHGDVFLDVWVDAAGVPVKIFPLWGPPELKPTAVKYMSQWRFSEKSPSGTPTRFYILMPFRLLNGGIYKSIPDQLRKLI